MTWFWDSIFGCFFGCRLWIHRYFAKIFMMDKNWHLRLPTSFCLSDVAWKCSELRIKSVLDFTWKSSQRRIKRVSDVAQAHRTLLAPPHLAMPRARTLEISKNKNASAVFPQLAKHEVIQDFITVGCGFSCFLIYKKCTFTSIRRVGNNTEQD